jgi:hypothetical protein
MAGVIVHLKLSKQDVINYDLNIISVFKERMFEVMKLFETLSSLGNI